MLDRVLLMAASDGLPGGLPPKETSNLFGLSARDLTIFVGVAVLIALVLFAWVYITRRDRRGYLARSPRMSEPGERRREEGEGRTRSRRRRRRHPDNLPRNPTLGETGGLPPIRPDEPAQPA